MNQSISTFPIAKVRSQFPALNRTYKGQPVTYFDGPGGTQVVRASIEGVTKYMENGGANLHGAFPTSRETEEMISEAKLAIGDFLGVKENEVAFGANMTTLALAIARALGKQWGPGDEIVVTEMDHRANVDPWITMAEDRGIKVRWISVNKDSLTLNLDNLQEVINENTRLVAVGLASNAVGTINDIASISKVAKGVGALVAVDAVHAAPHVLIDRDSLGIDILLCSAYKFFGPHVGIAAIKEELFERIEPFKLNPAPSYIPDKLETGTQNHEGIAGIKPAIEFMASLGIGATRKEKLQSGLMNIDMYENELAARLREGLASIPKVTLYQAAPGVAKTPTIAFTIEGYTPLEVCQRMAEEHGIFIADGHFYATTLAEKLGIIQSGSWIRAGLAPYNTLEEVERFIKAVKLL
ncbi:cysteine desulfurase family protein (TIGR01976 family) [Bacillus mesophilus]|uniref:Cysteine desulfurase-like protein n=1 Tax=Bacillus mesophilus TaxID=1808955 RepID=A0A6M0Q8P9_9BACI|nr:cysteine desulfurase-like protein [Bacillus mesophilus]MBM7661988.1 cysteine desulfurase family protein (TIGR01976 family) [Bacillus mesophilus]NEY72653.1 cysteine desulfurase-like protein [Bacillus mesophilus]